jgi:hypothetical protein
VATKRNGFGSVRVRAQIGDTEQMTSVFPDSKRQVYVLPVKKPVVHWEIQARDPDAQRAFYAGLFNWVIGDGPIMNIEAGLGGPEPGPAGHIRPSDASRISLYVQVGNLAAGPQHELLPSARVGRRSSPLSVKKFSGLKTHVCDRYCRRRR